MSKSIIGVIMLIVGIISVSLIAAVLITPTPEEQPAQPMPIPESIKMNTSEEVNNTAQVNAVINTPQEIEHNAEGTKYIETDCIGGDNHTIQLYHNPKALNLTYNEVIKFIELDKTDEKPYIPGEFICGDFAEVVQHNAENSGINCGLVLIRFNDSTYHMINAFSTTDKGIVYIDSTGGNMPGDAIDNLAVGQICIPQPISNNAVYGSLGQVESVKNYW